MNASRIVKAIEREDRAAADLRAATRQYETHVQSARVLAECGQWDRLVDHVRVCKKAHMRAVAADKRWSVARLATVSRIAEYRDKLAKRRNWTTKSDS